MLRACLGRREGRKAAAAAMEEGRLCLHNLSPSLTTCWTCKGCLFPWKRALPACAAASWGSLPSSNPHGEENKLQRSCPGAGSLIAAASLICIPLRKGKRTRKSPSCPLQRRSPLVLQKPWRCLRAEEVTSVTDAGLSTPKLPIPSPKLGLQALLPRAVTNWGHWRDVSPHFVPPFSLSSKLNIESRLRQEAQRLPGRSPPWQQPCICLCQLYPLPLHRPAQDTARTPWGGARGMLLVPEQCRACPWVQGTRKGPQEAGGEAQGHSRAESEVWRGSKAQSPAPSGCVGV